MRLRFPGPLAGVIYMVTGMSSTLAFVAPARARPARRVSLQYTRDERAQACIDPVSLARKVEAFTGPVLVAPSSAEAALEAHIEARSGGGFRARIQIGREGENAYGERVLETDSSDCRSFDDALSFVIATTIDPDLVLERVGVLFDPAATPAKEVLLEEIARTPVVTKAPERRPEVVRAKPKPTKPVATASEAHALVVGVGLNVNDELYVVGLGPAVLVRWQLYRWLAVGVGAHATFDAMEAPVDSGSVSRQEIAGSLLACPGWSWGARAALAVCLGPEFFLLHVAAHGLDDNKSGSLMDTGFLVRPELSVRLVGPYSVGAAASARIGGQKTLTYTTGPVVSESFHTPNVAVAGELSVARAF